MQETEDLFTFIKEISNGKLHYCLPFVSHKIHAIPKSKAFTLREKCPSTELFLVRIFLYSDHKYFRIWTIFT